MSEFKKYQRKGLSEMRPYINGEDLTNISVADIDMPPTAGGMIARNPENHDDQWYVNWEYFEKNLELAEEKTGKSLGNTDINGAHKNVKDIVVFGDGDMFQLLCKASSEREGWMKSTKALQVDGVGCLVQVTTQQRNPDGSYSVAEALTFMPMVKIVQDAATEGRVLVAI